MDGLIKGLMDVALGNDANDRDRDQQRQHSDDRSRSTWAEVVEGGNEGRSNQDSDFGGYNRPPRRHPHKEEYEEKSNEGWENAGPTQHQIPHKEDQEQDNDGWETVGRPKHRKAPHKVQMDQWSRYKRPACEQEYSLEFEGGDTLELSQSELSDLSQACNKLWELDVNRLVPGKDYRIDTGEGKKAYEKGDMAQGTLFSWLDEDVLRRPTVARFCSLLDNYNPVQGHKEVVTAEEREEQAAFIEEISRTAPIKYLHKYLVSKGIASEEYREFKRMLSDLWFDLYARGGTSGSSSAFEHVFVGEIKERGEQEVSGFHNWLQFYLEEAKGRVDYQGYIFPRRRCNTPDSETQLLTIQFEWNGVLKSVSSAFIGVSPEFELALYTLCFYVGEEDNHVEIGPYAVNIKCYRCGNRIGSAFPIAEN